MTTRGWWPDPFLIAIALAVLAAALAPHLGAQDGPLHVHEATRIAVTLVFFLHGAVLPLEALRRGLKNIRLHLVSQAVTFLVFPALGAFILLAGRGLPSAIALGFFFMSTVSSTISSSVALTAVARGDTAGALFNATLSGILGVFLTPLYASLVAKTAGVTLSLPSVMQTVSLTILLPLALGQLSRPLCGSFFRRFPHVVHWTDRTSIVLIVYGASRCLDSRRDPSRDHVGRDCPGFAGRRERCFARTHSGAPNGQGLGRRRLLLRLTKESRERFADRACGVWNLYLDRPYRDAIARLPSGSVSGRRYRCATSWGRKTA